MKLRAVLDTNVIVSALLFSGLCSRLVPLWQKGDPVLLLSRPVLDEYLRVLAYPKFDLTNVEVRFLIEEEILPYAEVVNEKKMSVPKLKDRDDEKFLRLALSGNADFIVSGDETLLDLKNIGHCRIVTPGEFLETLATPP